MRIDGIGKCVHYIGVLFPTFNKIIKEILTLHETLLPKAQFYHISCLFVFFPRLFQLNLRPCRLVGCMKHVYN